MNTSRHLYDVGLGLIELYDDDVTETIDEGYFPPMINMR